MQSFKLILSRLNSLKGTDRQIDYSWRFILWICEYDPILRYTAVFQMGACTRPGPRLGMYFILMIIICVRFSIKELTTSSSLHRWERCAGSSSDTLVSLFSAPQRSFLLAGRSSNSTQCITFLFKTGRYPTKFHHRRRGEKGIFWALDHELVAFFNVALYSLWAWNIRNF